MNYNKILKFYNRITGKEAAQKDFVIKELQKSNAELRYFLANLQSEKVEFTKGKYKILELEEDLKNTKHQLENSLKYNSELQSLLKEANKHSSKVKVNFKKSVHAISNKDQKSKTTLRNPIFPEGTFTKGDYVKIAKMANVSRATVVSTLVYRLRNNKAVLIAANILAEFNLKSIPNNQ